MGIDYDAWLEKPYQEMYDREATHWFNCSEVNELDPDEEKQEDGLPYCDFEGDVDCYTESSSGRGWWEIKYIGECPKCKRELIDSEGDEADERDRELW